MKKRVVAVLLSMSMCMATVAQASVASAADFSADIAVAEDNEESVTGETDNSEDVDDSTVTIEDGDVTGDEQTDADITPDADVDFGAGEDFSSDVTPEIPDTLDENDAAAAGVTYPGEKVVSNTEATLSYHRWIAKSVNGVLKWQLHKYTGSNTASVGESEAQDTAQETEDDTVATVAVEAADVADETADTTADSEQETDPTPVAEDETAPAAEDETTDENADGVEGVNPNYYTAADGLVQITSLDANERPVFTAKYAFDDRGYLITGKSLVGTNGNDYYYFATADEVEVENPYVDSEFSEVVTPYNSGLGSMQSDKWVWNGTVFNYYNQEGVCEAKNEGI